MSVQLQPPNTLNFNRPLTQLVKRTLSIHNPNGQAVVFKVKTTAPKLYCVRPNSGTIPAKESVEVSVMLQPMKEEPPLNAKCKDKFLIQSTFVPPEKEGAQAAEIWSSIDSSEDGRVQQQKLKVAYLPPEGQTVEEEDEGHMSSILNANDSHFDTVRQHPANGTFQPIPDFTETKPVPPPIISISGASSEQRETSTPAPEPRVPTPEPAPAEQAPVPTQAPVEPEPEPAPVHVPAPEPKHEPAPAPVSVPPPAPVPEFIAPPVVAAPPAPKPVSRSPTQSPEFQELVAKYKEAQREIERLQTVLASSTPVELRRRNRTLVDDGSTIVGSDVGTTVVDDGLQYQQPEGVPLQIVVAIAFAVFVTTYLFF